jgi:hypothetical protein
MGWYRDDGREDSWEHEGFPVLVVKEPGEWAWRELGMGKHGRPDDLTIPEGASVRIQAGCECGWRSHRMSAPLGVEWMPFSVLMSEVDEDAVYEVWRVEHRDRLPHCTSYRCPISHPTGGLVSRG